MKKLWLVLIACMIPYAANAGYQSERLRYEMWLEVCLNISYSCEGVAPPAIEYQSMRRGLNGFDNGTDTVYVSKHLWGEQKRATIFHEMTHYVQTKVGGLKVPGFAAPICAAEAEAFAETDAWWERIGRPWMKRGADWWKPYAHCRQFYDPSYVPPHIWWF